MDPPWQKVVGPPGEMLTEGGGFTVTEVGELVAEHPFEFVIVTE